MEYNNEIYHHKYTFEHIGDMIGGKSNHAIIHISGLQDPGN
uniref:Uncharacterized protein n=1 Tax=viral metagenome TaxID=1070528 RepID=A0A6C0CC71_9ZZZZ